MPGIVDKKSYSQLLHVIQNLMQRGAQEFILACIKIGLSVHENDTTSTLYDTTRIHALVAAESKKIPFYFFFISIS
jgi:aspartate racemase